MLVLSLRQWKSRDYKQNCIGVMFYMQIYIVEAKLLLNYENIFRYRCDWNQSIFNRYDMVGHIKSKYLLNKAII